MNTLLIAALLSCLPLFFMHAQPKIEIQQEFNWGDIVPANSPVANALMNARIAIKNKGDQELYISSVKPACGCTSAPLEKDRLSPGETTWLNISLNASQANGNITKTVMITSNDPEKANHVLMLRANIIRPLKLSASSITFSPGIIAGMQGNASISITNQSKDPITISSLIPLQGLELKQESPITLQPGAVKEIKVAYKPVSSGTFTAALKVKTDMKEYPEFEIPAYGAAMPDIKGSAHTN
jgi:hypothetical protein